MSRALLSNIYHADRAQTAMAGPVLTRGGFCNECFEKQKEVDRLKEENIRLKVELGRRVETVKGKFEGSTHEPSSKKDFKENSGIDLKKRKVAPRKGIQEKQERRLTQKLLTSIASLIYPKCVRIAAMTLKVKGGMSAGF